MNEKELSLLGRLAPCLNKRLGPLVVWAFSASFMPQLWVSRVDYTIEGEDPSRQMKSVIIEGRDQTNNCVTIDSFMPVRPRIFLNRPSIAILREGLIMLELEGPCPGEREV